MGLGIVKFYNICAYFRDLYEDERSEEFIAAERVDHPRFLLYLIGSTSTPSAAEERCWRFGSALHFKWATMLSQAFCRSNPPEYQYLSVLILVQSLGSWTPLVARIRSSSIILISSMDSKGTSWKMFLRIRPLASARLM